MEKRTDLDTSNTEMVTISRAEYEAIQARLSGLEEQLRSKTEELAETLLKNQWLLENLKLTKKKLFGESSEQLDQMVIEKFGHLFNEAEGWDASSCVKGTKVKSHTRKRRSGSIEDVIPEGTPTEIVEHRLPEKDRIGHVCGAEMVEIGTEVHRSLQMKPAQFWVREDVYYTYACKACEQETGEAVVASTPREPSVLPGSYAGRRSCTGMRPHCRCCGKPGNLPPASPICGCTAPVAVLSILSCCMSTKRTEKQNTRKNFWTGSLDGFMQMDTKNTTNCQNASEWWAAQLMPDVNLMRH